MGALDVDAVVLDAGGVLLLPDPDAMRAAVAPFGAHPDDEQCRRAHYTADRELDRLGVADWRVIDRAVAAALGVDDRRLDDAVHAIEPVYLSKPWVPIAGAAETLVALDQAGFQLAIVSNATGTMEAQLEEHRICSVTGGDAAPVAIVVDSEVVGVEKPDPAIFAIALEALSLPAERCVYVGDTVYFDVAGARAAGLHPVHVDPYGWCPHDDHAHVGSITEILDGFLSASRS